MCKVAYVVKRYPRFSETFIVNEILAHEQAGLELEIFSLRPPCDTHFQDLISQVRAPLTYLSTGAVKATELWDSIRAAQAVCPGWNEALDSVAQEDPLDIYCGLQLAVAVVRRGITHMHAHFASSPATVAHIASAISGVPYSLTAHAKDIFHESVVPQELANKIAASKVAFTVSDFNLRYFQQRFAPDISGNVVRLYNGMHLSQFPFNPSQPRARQILAVGRLVEKKGFADLVTACHHLRSRNIPFSCLIVGGGELWHALQQQIHRLDLHAQVQLLGPQPQQVVKQLMSESCVLAAPCIEGADGNRDGLPTVLLEAMALGTPCISTAVTGIPEVISHGQTGLLIDQHQPEQLAVALAQLLDDGELRLALATAARGLLEDEFDIDKTSARQREYFAASSPVRVRTTAAQWMEV